MPQPSDLDIYRTANLLIQRLGSTAALEAQVRAEEMQQRGDDDGHAAWLRILRAVEALQAPAGTVH